MSNAVVLLVVLVLLAGALAFGTPWSLEVAAWLVLATAFTAVGAAVVSRVPENAFGWVLLSIGATSAVTVSTWSTDVYELLAWLRSWIVRVPVGLLPIALLLFPTGRLPSARWRVVLVLAVVGVIVPAFFLAVASAIEPDPVGFFGAPAGPAVEGLLTAARLGTHVAAVSLLLGVVSLFARLRRASDTEPRQILCLFLGAIALCIGLALEYAGVNGAWVAGAAALPIAAGAHHDPADRSSARLPADQRPRERAGRQHRTDPFPVTVAPVPSPAATCPPRRLLVKESGRRTLDPIVAGHDGRPAIRDAKGRG